MKADKEKLSKLLSFVEEMAEQPGNEWFKTALQQKFGITLSEIKQSPQIEEIYEFCIGKVMTKQAVAFYKDFPITGINSELVKDYVRMERYRRENNFGDFCLAAFQQLELIINHLTNEQLLDYVRKNLEKISYRVKTGKDKFDDKKLRDLIFRPDITKEELKTKIDGGFEKWYFSEKLTIVVYYYMYSCEVKYHPAFKEYVLNINNLYQIRNTNHRGSKVTDWQQNVIDDIMANKERNFIRFLALLDEFTEKIITFFKQRPKHEKVPAGNSSNSGLKLPAPNEPSLAVKTTEANKKF